MTTYVATNIKTGEVIEGGAREVAKQLGVVANTIYNSVSTRSKVKFVWIITKCDTVSDNPYRFPQQLLEEWDRVTESYKRLSRRRRLCRYR